MHSVSTSARQHVSSRLLVSMCSRNTIKRTAPICWLIFCLLNAACFWASPLFAQNSPTGTGGVGRASLRFPSSRRVPTPPFIIDWGTNLLTRVGGVIVRYGPGRPANPGDTNSIFPTKGASFAYVVDISGSMGAPSGGNGMTRQDRLDEALTNSINGLTTKQSFYINAFANRPHPMPTNALVLATAANKKTYIDWYLAEGKGGGTYPLDSMTAALDLKPAVIFLLTDGAFDQPPVEQLINTRNADRKIIIHTICLGEQFSEAFLKKIASENGGTYRFISDQPPPAGGPVDNVRVPNFRVPNGPPSPSGGAGSNAMFPTTGPSAATIRTNFIDF